MRGNKIMASRDQISFSSSCSNNLSPSFSIFSLSSCSISILINISIFIFCLQSTIQSVEAVRTSSIQSAGQEFYPNGQTSQKLMQAPKDAERNGRGEGISTRGRGEGISTRGRGEGTRNATRTIPGQNILTTFPSLLNFSLSLCLSLSFSFSLSLDYASIFSIVRCCHHLTRSRTFFTS